MKAARLHTHLHTQRGAWWALMLQALLLALVLSVAGAARAQGAVGQITRLQGMATAQQPDGSMRFLGEGDAVLEGDTLSTTDRGFAIVTLNDGSKYTLRPSTTFTLERFAHGQDAEATWLHLLKGGVRMVTGLVGKRNPAGVRLRTATATLGVRGTRFDARLCGADCRAEAALQTPAAAAPAVALPVAARVVQLRGQASAITADGASRALAEGGALFEGEQVRTAADATLVLGFRDQSVVSVNPDTVLRIQTFRFNQPQAEDSMMLGLLRGGLRALTGLIGRQSPEAVKIKTATSVIGIRGTGMDISCEGPCADPQLGLSAAPPGDGTQSGDGLFMVAWQGTPYFERGPLDVPLERAGHIGADGLPRILLAVPEFMRAFAAPRPDGVPVDWNQLFAAIDPAGADGLYVYVREGHVFIRSGDSVVDLGPGEAGWSGREGQAHRIEPVPGFLVRDPLPLPESFSQSRGPLLQLFGVTLGQPGQEICRI